MSKIVISYRRSDTADIVGRIYDRLTSHYGTAAVFVDIDNIAYGINFRDDIRKALAGSEVVLAVVGPDWRGAGPDGHRIDHERDPVRVEIETSLQMGVRIIPVLVKGARMPADHNLPESLKAFPDLNAAEVRSGRDFDTDIGRLLKELEKILRPSLSKEVRSNAEGAVAERVPLRFADLGANLGRPATGAVTAVVVLPIAAWLATLAPGWPSGIVTMTIAAALAVLWSIYRWLRGKSPPTVRRVTIAATAAMVVLVFTYLLTFPILTFQATPSDNRWARGFVCTPEARAVYKDRCPNLGVDQLRQAEFVAERLWTESSIAVVRLAVIALWLSIFLAFAALMAAMLARRRGSAD